MLPWASSSTNLTRGRKSWTLLDRDQHWKNTIRSTWLIKKSSVAHVKAGSNTVSGNIRTRARKRERERETDIADLHRDRRKHTDTSRSRDHLVPVWQANTYIHTCLYHGYLASIDSSYRKLDVQTHLTVPSYSSPPEGCHSLLYFKGSSFRQGFLSTTASSVVSPEGMSPVVSLPHCSLPFSDASSSVGHFCVFSYGSLDWIVI